MKPFIKWVGGKNKLLPQLLPLFPKKIRTYYEPFMGGGAVFFNLAEEKRFEMAVINDWNADLVETYKVVRDFPTDLIASLRQAQDEYREDPKEVFDRWRRPSGTFDALIAASPLHRATRFIFLNKTCFNGLHRVNKKGEFNTPWGQNPKAGILDEAVIQACSKALSGPVTIRQGDFEAAVEGAVEGDCVYFDPPYVPLNVTSSFTSYTSEGFGKPEQERLGRLVRSLMDRGVSVIVSNSAAPLVRDIYAGLEIHEIDAARSINSKGDGRGKIKELAIVSRQAITNEEPEAKPMRVVVTVRSSRRTSAPQDWQTQVMAVPGVEPIDVSDGLLRLNVTHEAMCRLQGTFGSFAFIELDLKHAHA